LDNEHLADSCMYIGISSRLYTTTKYR